MDADRLDPSRYVEKVHLATGATLDDPITPEELLVRSHRDGHVVDIYARTMMSLLVDVTDDEALVTDAMKEVRRIGHRASELLAKALGAEDHDAIAERLFGLKEREHYFRYRRQVPAADVMAAHVAKMKGEARSRLEAAGGVVRVLLTGGTGFVGKEILHRAASDPGIATVFVLIRPKTLRDRDGNVRKTLTAEDRGQALVDELGLGEAGAKLRFLAGDIEAPRLGLSDADFALLADAATHVLHCAARVAFDDPYERSFEANVLGSLNALTLSKQLQEAPRSPFVAHLSVETSYIHGRQTHAPAREDEVVFPRNYYNNYYELTKAMASIETERFMLEEGLRVVQLCPSIVVGDARTGNNRGDQMVVIAPVNAFGRAEEALAGPEGWLPKTQLLARLASLFPGNNHARINLVPVDRVAAGILAALVRPEAVGERIHLATDRLIDAEQMRDIIGEELHAKVLIAEPTLHRTVSLPVMTTLLAGLGQDRLVAGLTKLAEIFGGYAEWGQPVHEVGNDHRLLGLPAERPDTAGVFRMLCRHNKYVQRFGRVRDAEEIARRERLWRDFIDDLERLAGRPAGTLSADEFEAAVGLALDVESFTRRDDPRAGSAPRLAAPV